MTGEASAMIRIERDPAFWASIAENPAVAATLGAATPAQVGALARLPHFLPLASEHGGFLFGRMDPLGFTCELHSLFAPEGWGREALVAGVRSIGFVWALGYQLVTTFEVQGNSRSRPPKTFGFTMAGDWRETPLGTLRLWTLTQAAWNASPARRLKCLH